MNVATSPAEIPYIGSLKESHDVTNWFFRDPPLAFDQVKLDPTEDRPIIRRFVVRMSLVCGATLTALILLSIAFWYYVADLIPLHGGITFCLWLVVFVVAFLVPSGAALLKYVDEMTDSTFAIQRKRWKEIVERRVCPVFLEQLRRAQQDNNPALCPVVLLWGNRHYAFRQLVTLRQELTDGTIDSVEYERQVRHLLGDSVANLVLAGKHVSD